VDCHRRPTGGQPQPAARMSHGGQGRIGPDASRRIAGRATTTSSRSGSRLALRCKAGR
jgi:hypothetical protein